MQQNNQMQQNKTCFLTYHLYLQVTIPVLLYNLYNDMGWGQLYSVS